MPSLLLTFTAVVSTALSYSPSPASAFVTNLPHSQLNAPSKLARSRVLVPHVSQPRNHHSAPIMAADTSLRTSVRRMLQSILLAASSSVVAGAPVLAKGRHLLAYASGGGSGVPVVAVAGIVAATVAITKASSQNDGDQTSSSPFAGFEEVEEDEEPTKMSQASPTSVADALTQDDDELPSSLGSFSESDLMSSLQQRMSSINLDDETEEKEDSQTSDSFEFGGTAMLERPSDASPPATHRLEPDSMGDGLPDSLGWEAGEFDESIETAPGEHDPSEIERLNKMFKL